MAPDAGNKRDDDLDTSSNPERRIGGFLDEASEVDDQDGDDLEDDDVDEDEDDRSGIL